MFVLYIEKVGNTMIRVQMYTCIVILHQIHATIKAARMLIILNSKQDLVLYPLTLVSNLNIIIDGILQRDLFQLDAKVRRSVQIMVRIVLKKLQLVQDAKL
jgi:hypothetical protein